MGSALVNCISSNLEPAKISAVIGEKTKDLRRAGPKVSRRNFPDMSDSSGELFFWPESLHRGKPNLRLLGLRK